MKKVERVVIENAREAALYLVYRFTKSDEPINTQAYEALGLSHQDLHGSDLYSQAVQLLFKYQD